MKPAIQVENLSKLYLIGRAQQKHDTLRDALANVKPWPRIASIFRKDHSHRLNNSLQDDLLWALKDVSFEVQPGEVVGIIGRNGAGKSTLLKILSRITEPTSGRAVLNGRVGSLLEVGTGFHPELTGRENIYLNGAILGMRRTEIEKKFDEIVAFSEIEKFLDTPVKRYSSGMYVRLAFAVAAHLEPEILLVDEVLAVGDAAFQKKCLGKMGEVAKEGRTVLFVSHNMGAIQSLCGKGIAMRNGMKICEDSPDIAIRSYLQDGIQKQATDLVFRTDRKGSGDIKFTRVKFLDGRNGHEAHMLISGMPLLIELEYEKRDSRTISGFDVSIGFFTQLGTLMFACRSSARGQYFQVEKAKGRFYCKVPKWPLASGIYYYNIYSESRGAVLDWIQEVGRVEVEAGDFYGTGKVPASTMQSVFIDYEWQSSDSE